MLEARRARVLGELHPELRRRVTLLLNDMGGRVTPYCGYRGPKEQVKAKADGYSHADWLESPHNYAPSFACDLVLHPTIVGVRAHPKSPDFPWLWDDETPFALVTWADLERGAEKYGLDRVNVGGKRDRPHVELPNWRKLIAH